MGELGLSNSLQSTTKQKKSLDIKRKYEEQKKIENITTRGEKAHSTSLIIILKNVTKSKDKMSLLSLLHSQ